VTAEVLTAILAERVMGWTVGPERFLLGHRRWIPRWRFQPFSRLEDAFHLLEKANCTYSFTTASDGKFAARVRIGNRVGRSSGDSKARAITMALAVALGIEVDL
jgi:hypothetical protein